MISRRTFLARAAALSALSLLDACGEPPPAPSRYDAAEIGLAVAAPTAALLPVYVAEGQGFFVNRALTVRVLEGITAAASLKRLIYAEAQAVICDASVAAPVINGNGNLVGAASLAPPGWTFALPPGIASLAGLKGSPVAVCPLLGAESVAADVALHAAGATDLSFRTVDNRQALLEAVSKGATGLLAQPDAYRLEGEGRRLAPMPDGAAAGSVDLYVDRGWVAGNRSPVVRLLQALLEAQRWLQEPSHRPEAARTLGAATGTDPAQALRAHDDALKRGDYGRGLEPDTTAIQALLRLSPNGPFRAPGQYFDPSLLRDARR